jgi:hypothetical protein
MSLPAVVTVSAPLRVARVIWALINFLILLGVAIDAFVLFLVQSLNLDARRLPDFYLAIVMGDGPWMLIFAYMTILVGLIDAILLLRLSPGWKVLPTWPDRFFIFLNAGGCLAGLFLLANLAYQYLVS